MMNKRDIAFLACRVLGLYTWIHVVFRLEVVVGGTYGLFVQARSETAGVLFPWILFMGTSLPLILFVGIGSLLWFGAGWLSQRMVGGGASEGERAAVDGEAVQGIVFSAIGLFVLVEGVPSFAAQVMTLAMTWGEAPLPYDPYGWRWTTAVAAGLIKIGMGLWLLLGARGIVGAVSWLRRVGLEAVGWLRRAGLKSEGESSGRGLS